MSPTRRTFLQSGILFGSIGLAGCSSPSDRGTTADGDGRNTATETSSNEDTPEMPPMETKLSLVEQSTSDCPVSDPIVFAELSTKQQEMVQTAIDEGEYTEQHGDESPSLQDFRDMVENQTNGGGEAYLRHDDTCYAIELVAGDHIIAAPS